VLVFADRPYYAAYGTVRSIMSIDLLNDQVLGGLIMWVPGESLHLLAIGLIFAVWYRKSQRDAGEVHPAPARRRKIDVG